MKRIVCQRMCWLGITVCMLFPGLLGCTSCQHRQNQVSYVDSAYIASTGDMLDSRNRGYEDFIAAERAERRMNVRIEKDRFVWNGDNANEVRISDNLYNYIIKKYGTYNKRLATGRYVIKGMEIESKYLPVEDTKTGLYADSIILEFRGNLNDPELTWNRPIYNMAYERMLRHLQIVDGRFAWDVKCGQDVKISDNVFDYIVDCWTEDNYRLATGKYEIWCHKEDDLYYYMTFPIGGPSGTTFFKRYIP